MRYLAAAVVGIALGTLAVWFSYRAGSEIMLGLILFLLLAQNFYQGWQGFQENGKAKAFRNEMRRRLDEIQKVPELLTSEKE